MPSLDIAIAQSTAFLISLPSAALYAAECFVIVRGWNKHFKGSFFKLFLLTAVNNLLLNFASSFFNNRFQKMSMFTPFYLSLPKWLSRLVFASNFYPSYVENFLIFGTLLQRLTVILRPMDNEEIWRYLFPITAFVAWTVPLALVSHLFYLNVQWTQTGLDYDHAANPNAPSNSKLMAITSAVFILATSLLNVFILAAFKRVRERHLHAQSSHANSANHTLEVRLVIYALLMFAIQSFVCAYWVLLYLLTSQPSVRIAVSNQYEWLNDLRSVVFPAWFLLWASTEVKHQLVRMLLGGLGHPAQVTPVIMIHPVAENNPSLGRNENAENHHI